MKCLHKDVIRASAAGVFTILRRIKRLLQMMALIVIVAFMTSVLYQSVHGLKDLEVCMTMMPLDKQFVIRKIMPIKSHRTNRKSCFFLFFYLFFKFSPIIYL